MVLFLIFVHVFEEFKVLDSQSHFNRFGPGLAMTSEAVNDEHPMF